MTKSILVTGCAGFIGSRVAALLTEQGQHVVGIDNMNNYYDVSLKQHRLQQLEKQSEFDFRGIDLENRDAIGKVFEEFDFDTVVNLAARAGVRYSMENPLVYMTTNALGSLNLLEAMRKHDVGKYMLASTSSLYAGQPMPFTEDLPVNTPISSYAASKKSAELMAYSHHFLYGIDVSICRYFTVYGPAGRPDMSIFRFIKWIDQEQPIELFGDGTQSRDFTFVDDIARGTIAALKPVGYEIFNLGGGNQPISLITIIEKLEALLGKTARINNKPFHKADIDSTWADISKANQQLNWRPATGLDEGLEQCVRWYRDQLPWSAEISIQTPCV
jgi:nucleoside-diphosphate-sugar epimerase